MNPISAAELASIQSDVAAAACDKACVIQEKVTTKDGMGQATENWVTISPANLKAGMTQPTGTHLQNYDYLIGALATWLLKFPIGTTVNVQNHVLIAGRTLVVQVILDPHSYPGLLPVLASEVE